MQTADRQTNTPGEREDGKQPAPPHLEVEREVGCFQKVFVLM